FPLVLEHVSGMATVDDASLLRTMFYLWERLKLVVEPTGALAAAAAIDGRTPLRGARVGVILSGGNVDLSQGSAWLAAVGPGRASSRRRSSHRWRRSGRNQARRGRERLSPFFRSTTSIPRARSTASAGWRASRR